MQWKDRVKIINHLSDMGPEYSHAWEEIYQAFKERMITERLEKEKVLESECEHVTVTGDSYTTCVKYKYCPDCGEKL